MSALVSIDRESLSAVHGGYDLQRTLNAGSAGADHGSFVGRGMGQDAAAALLPRSPNAGIASAFHGAGIGYGNAGMARAQQAYRDNDFRTAAAISKAGNLGSMIGSGVGWVSGAASDAWSQLTGH